MSAITKIIICYSVGKTRAVSTNSIKKKKKPKKLESNKVLEGRQQKKVGEVWDVSQSERREKQEKVGGGEKTVELAIY